KVCLARLIRGQVHAHESIHGASHPDDSEKMGGLFFPVGGKKRVAIEEAAAGNIVAFSKVEKVGIGETFTATGEDLVQIASPPIPVPMVALAIQPKSRADEQKIGEALHKLEAEDPTFRIEHDPETHELIAHGMSDLHLQVVEAMLKRRFNVEIEKHLPKIAFRETVTKAAEGHHRHKKQSGGKGQFGECYIRLKPLAEGEGFIFKDAVVGGSIPRNLIPAVEKGIQEQIEKGVLVHSKVVDVEVELYDGKFHAVDSDEASFKAAGARAFREGFAKAGPVLLEPTVELEIHVPTSDAGTIFSDITSQRRGHVLDQWTESDGAITVIKAEAPMSTVQTYNRDLKSQTSGEGFYVQEQKGYSRMPAAEQKRVLAEATLDHGDD
ncbi:MAG: elongation factor G, partial [Planctomycetota bacterium]